MAKNTEKMAGEASPTSLKAAVTAVARQLRSAKLHFGHGTTNARDEAAWLCLHALGLPLDEDLACIADLKDHEWQAIQHWVDLRISTRKPVAYLTQEAWLQGVPFYVDERSIIPRSFIAEVLADGSIDPWLSDQTTRVLDLCTGNGSLAVLAALAFPDVQVDAADLSADALEVAQINVAKHGLQPRITLLQGNGLSACTNRVQQHGRYHLILCNPPYVNAASMAKLPVEYLAEPRVALASGPDGMDFCRQLLRDAAKFLAEDGVLVLEIGNERRNFEAAFSCLEPVWLTTSAGDDAVLVLTAEQLKLGCFDPNAKNAAVSTGLIRSIRATTG